MRAMRRFWILAGLGLIAGCENSCRGPYDPDPVPTPQAQRTLRYENYEDGGPGSWVAASPSLQVGAVMGGSGARGQGALSISSAGGGAVEGERCLNAFGSLTDAVRVDSALSVSFYYHAGSLSSTASVPARMSLEVDGVRLWSLALERGESGGWRHVLVHSRGAGLLWVSFDGGRPLALAPGGPGPVEGSGDLLRLDAGQAFSFPGARLLLDEVLVSSP